MKRNPNVQKMLKKVEADNKKFQKMLDKMGGHTNKLAQENVETEAEKDFKKRMQMKQREYDRNQKQIDEEIKALEKKLEEIERQNEKLHFDFSK